MLEIIFLNLSWSSIEIVFKLELWRICLSSNILGWLQVMLPCLTYWPAVQPPYTIFSKTNASGFVIFNRSIYHTCIWSCEFLILWSITIPYHEIVSVRHSNMKHQVVASGVVILPGIWHLMPCVLSSLCHWLNTETFQPYTGIVSQAGCTNSARCWIWITSIAIVSSNTCNRAHSDGSCVSCRIPSDVSWNIQKKVYHIVTDNFVNLYFKHDFIVPYVEEGSFILLALI